MVAAAGKIEQRVDDGGLTACKSQCADALLERRNPLLEDIRRRIHDPRVDVAEFFQREQTRRVAGIVKKIRRRLIDRDCAGFGGWIARVAAVNGDGFEIWYAVLESCAHVNSSFLRWGTKQIKKPPTGGGVFCVAAQPQTNDSLRRSPWETAHGHGRHHSGVSRHAWDSTMSQSRGQADKRFSAGRQRAPLGNYANARDAAATTTSRTPARTSRRNAA